MRTGSLVVVNWVDSTSGNGWCRDDVAVDSVDKIESVGWVLKSTRDALVLVPNRSVSAVDRHVLHEIAIPQKAVVSYVELIK
jgi:hypothetical protein